MTPRLLLAPYGPIIQENPVFPGVPGPAGWYILRLAHYWIDLRFLIVDVLLIVTLTTIFTKSHAELGLRYLSLGLGLLFGFAVLFNLADIGVAVVAGGVAVLAALAEAGLTAVGSTLMNSRSRATRIVVLSCGVLLAGVVFVVLSYVTSALLYALHLRKI